MTTHRLCLTLRKTTAETYWLAKTSALRIEGSEKMFEALLLFLYTISRFLLDSWIVSYLLVNKARSRKYRCFRWVSLQCFFHVSACAYEVYVLHCFLLISYVPASLLSLIRNKVTSLSLLPELQCVISERKRNTQLTSSPPCAPIRTDRFHKRSHNLLALTDSLLPSFFLFFFFVKKCERTGYEDGPYRTLIVLWELIESVRAEHHPLPRRQCFIFLLKENSTSLEIKKVFSFLHFILLWEMCTCISVFLFFICIWHVRLNKMHGMVLRLTSLL